MGERKGFFDFLNSGGFAKAAAWLSGSLITLGQMGVHIGHVGNTDYNTLLAVLFGGAAVHAASNSSKQNDN